MKIVVTTPTGRVGSRVASLIVQAGARPTLLARNPSGVDQGIGEYADVVQADQTDVDAVLDATRGADALYWVSPPVGAEDPVAAHAELGAIVARAVSENRIERTVFQSSVGAERRSGMGEIDGLAATEEALDATGASVLHLRCGMFFTNLLMDPAGLEEGVLRTTWPIEMGLPWVDPRDIGEVAAARLLSTDWSGSGTQAVHGPEDLSYADVARTLSEATGRTMRAEQISDDELRAGLERAGLGPKQIEAMVGMPAGFRDGFTPENQRSVLTTTPTTLAAWAEDNVSLQSQGGV